MRSFERRVPSGCGRAGNLTEPALAWMAPMRRRRSARSTFGVVWRNPAHGGAAGLLRLSSRRSKPRMNAPRRVKARWKNSVADHGSAFRYHVFGRYGILPVRWSAAEKLPEFCVPGAGAHRKPAMCFWRS